MFKIKTLNPIATVGLNQFPRELYEIGADIASPDAILVRSKNCHDITIPNSVIAIGRAGAGINNIPVDALTKRGIPVFNTPGANANAVKELVIAGMLLACRNICPAWDYVNHLHKQGNALNEEIEQNKKRFAGSELMGKRLGIIGLGSIGVKVANAAICLGMKVSGFDPTITVNRAWELSAKVKQAHSIDDLLMTADYVSFHVPLTDSTKHMINQSRLSSMKPSVVILNFARDGIIDNEALLLAILEKKIGAYVTDFPSEALRNHSNVISLPHLGASTKEAEDNCAVMIASQLRNFIEHGGISHAVNFPDVDAPQKNSGVRLAIVNANIPNMVAQISAKLADAHLNILSLINKSLADIAYTLIDVHTAVSPELLKHIANIQGVIQVRCINSHNSSSLRTL